MQTFAVPCHSGVPFPVFRFERYAVIVRLAIMIALIVLDLFPVFPGEKFFGKRTSAVFNVNCYYKKQNHNDSRKRQISSPIMA
jgi:hypothetical protein